MLLSELEVLLSFVSRVGGGSGVGLASVVTSGSFQCTLVTGDCVVRVATTGSVDDLGAVVVFGFADTLGAAGGVGVSTLGTAGVLGSRTLGDSSSACCGARGARLGGEHVFLLSVNVVVQSWNASESC